MSHADDCEKFRDELNVEPAILIMSKLTEIQKAIEELGRKRSSFATGSMDLTLLRIENGPLKSGCVKSSEGKWLLLMASKC